MRGGFAAERALQCFTTQIVGARGQGDLKMRQRGAAHRAEARGAEARGAGARGCQLACVRVSPAGAGHPNRCWESSARGMHRQIIQMRRKDLRPSDRTKPLVKRQVHTCIRPNGSDIAAAQIAHLGGARAAPARPGPRPLATTGRAFTTPAQSIGGTAHVRWVRHKTKRQAARARPAARARGGSGGSAAAAAAAGAAHESFTPRSSDFTAFRTA